MNDPDAREIIRKSLDESLIVEAAAGTGKTSELVRRLVSVLRTGRARVDQIVAVTFTRKAAGELKLRLREALDQERSQAVNEEELENLERSIAQLEEARIGTIHSFCGDLLRERPVEARVDPAFEELAEDEAPALFDRAFNRWIEEKLADPPAGLQRALNRSLVRQSFGGSTPLGQIKAGAWKLVEWRDFPQPWRREPFARESQIDALLRGVRDLSDMSERCRNWRDDLRKGLRPVRDLATWTRRAEQDGSRSYERLEGLLIQLQRDLNKYQNKKKGRGDFAPDLPRKVVLEARDSLISELEEFKRQADADLAALLQCEFQEVVQRYEELKRKSGKLDFVDLLIYTRNLIRDDPTIRAYFQQRFTHIFVDEFQDTDPLQAEIMLLLSADDPEATDWLKVKPKAGKLFLVGDPKQSIYRFRRADVQLYQQIREALQAGGVKLVLLKRSFRSSPAIQRLVNASFAPEMKDDRRVGQPDYVALEHARPEQEGQPSMLVLPPPRPYSSFGNLTNSAIESCLPDATGALVDWMLNQSGWTIDDPEHSGARLPLAPRHICILFRRFVSWGSDVTRDYTRSLEVRGVPHVLVGSRSFHQREEVETLRAALTAIEWPDDELSVYATLRGSLFWIRDALLLRFQDEFGSLYPFRSIPEQLEADLAPVAESLGTLARLHRMRNRRPIVETVNELLSSTRSHAGFALRPAGHQVLANVQRICDLARKFEANGGISFRAFVEFLDTEAAKPGASQAAVLEEGVDGVHLMTVHSAKGLEFPVVVLADLTAKLSSAHPDKYVNPGKELAAFTLMGCAPWELIDHEEEEGLRDRAEGVRVAYVAATRARDLLVIPALGDGARAGWLEPLNKSIYPTQENWRRSEEALGCPVFGEASVLDRPMRFDGLSESSVRPGLHHPEVGDHSVVWWDPAVLNLGVQPNFGLQQERILTEDASGKAAQKGMEAYSDWSQQRLRALEAGAQPLCEVFTVTKPPPLPMPAESGPIRVAILPKPESRPTGARFGTLVHTILRDVGLEGDETQIADVARLHARVLEAGPEEEAAAADAVRSALAHPLLQQAASSAQCYRELPVSLKLEEGKILEGIVDLAFVDDSNRWVVLDFKTDADLESKRARYERQVRWYLIALARIGGRETEGWLLGI